MSGADFVVSNLPPESFKQTDVDVSPMEAESSGVAALEGDFDQYSLDIIHHLKEKEVTLLFSLIWLLY